MKATTHLQVPVRTAQSWCLYALRRPSSEKIKPVVLAINVLSDGFEFMMALFAIEYLDNHGADIYIFEDVLLTTYLYLLSRLTTDVDYYNLSSSLSHHHDINCINQRWRLHFLVLLLLGDMQSLPDMASHIPIRVNFY